MVNLDSTHSHGNGKNFEAIAQAAMENLSVNRANLMKRLEGKGFKVSEDESGRIVLRIGRDSRIGRELKNIMTSIRAMLGRTQGDVRHFADEQQMYATQAALDMHGRFKFPETGVIVRMDTEDLKKGVFLDVILREADDSPAALERKLKAIELVSNCLSNLHKTSQQAVGGAQTGDFFLQMDKAGNPTKPLLDLPTMVYLAETDDPEINQLLQDVKELEQQANESKQHSVELRQKSAKFKNESAKLRLIEQKAYDLLDLLTSVGLAGGNPVAARQYIRAIIDNYKNPVVLAKAAAILGRDLPKYNSLNGTRTGTNGRKDSKEAFEEIKAICHEELMASEKLLAA